MTTVRGEKQWLAEYNGTPIIFIGDDLPTNFVRVYCGTETIEFMGRKNEVITYRHKIKLKPKSERGPVRWMGRT